MGPGVRFGPKAQPELLQPGELSDCDMIHSPDEVVAPTGDITHLLLLLTDSCTTKQD